MRLLHHLEIFAFYVGLSAASSSAFAITEELMLPFETLGRTYSAYEMYFREQVVPTINEVIRDLKREFPYSIRDIPKSALKGDYEKDVDIPTYTLFHSIELFFRHPSEDALTDLKKVCDQNHPFSILLNLKYKLDKQDSTYYKQLKKFNFKSKYANLLMKKLQGTVIELVIAHGICRAFSTNKSEFNVKHVDEIAKVIIHLIREQRKEIPNLLTSDAIMEHIKELTFPECFHEEAFNWSRNSFYTTQCPTVDHKGIRDCAPTESGGWDRMMFIDSDHEKTHTVDLTCIRNLTRFIYENLLENYDYGKQWTVLVSRGSCLGKMKTNVVTFNVDVFTVIVYFSNPVNNPVQMPFDEINTRFGSKFWNLLKLWTMPCPKFFDSYDSLTENFQQKIDSYGYCKDTSLCAACSERYIGYVIDSNADVNYFSPCFRHSNIPFIIGSKKSEELQYPLNDSFDEENPLKWLDILAEKVIFLQNQYKKQLIKSIKRKIKLEKLAEEITEALEEE